MIGLEYICGLYNKKYVEVANDLGITRQLVHVWIKEKKRISQKHLPNLSKLFDLPEEYFQKELTEKDKLNIQELKINNDNCKLDLNFKDIKPIKLKSNSEKFMEIVKRSQWSRYFRIKELKGEIEFSTKGEVKSIERNYINELFINFKEKGIIEELKIRIHEDLVKDFLKNVKEGDLIEIWGNISLSNFVLEANGCGFLD